MLSSLAAGVYMYFRTAASAIRAHLQVAGLDYRLVKTLMFGMVKRQRRDERLARGGTDDVLKWCRG